MVEISAHDAVPAASPTITVFADSFPSVIRICPLTSSFSFGVVVPIPTLPSD